MRFKVRRAGRGGGGSDGRTRASRVGVRRAQVSEGYKFVYIAWCGEGVSGMLRGNLANHATDFENFLTVRRVRSAAARVSGGGGGGGGGAQQNQLGFHVRINARSENDLKEEDIIGKINKAKGADFVKVGTAAAAGGGGGE